MACKPLGGVHTAVLGALLLAGSWQPLSEQRGFPAPGRGVLTHQLLEIFCACSEASQVTGLLQDDQKEMLWVSPGTNKSQVDTQRAAVPEPAWCCSHFFRCL